MRQLLKIAALSALASVIVYVFVVLSFCFGR